MDAGRSTFERSSTPPLVYRRRAFPWRDVAPSASTARTLMYSLCWASAAPASARPPLTSLLLTTQKPSTRGDALAAAPSWQTVAMLLEACSSAAPLLHAMHLALALAQQLAGRMAPPRRVVMLTCGALACGGAPSDAAHGGAWGFARVLRLEHPSLRAQSTDYSGSARPAAPATTLAPTSEAEAAWMGGAHLARRLRASSAASPASRAGLACGVYAITGGLGGLGLRAAKSLVENSAVRVILSSRSGRVGRLAVDPEIGFEMRVVACDVGDAPDTLALLARAARVAGRARL